MNILMLEPFLGGSHKAFLEGIQQHSRHNIIPVTLPGRHWRWRMHGGGVSLALKSKELADDVDLIFASSMINLSAFLALTRPRFDKIPVIMYMHENQITQPLPAGQVRDNTFGYLNYLNALVADQLVFSSHFHHDSFMAALPDFLDQFPDQQHPDTIEWIRNASRVLHSGIDLSVFDEQPDTRNLNQHKVIVWNQRWTFDKNPGLFFRVMNRLDDAGFRFDLVLAGDNRHDKPEEFEKAWRRYGNRIIHYGYVDDIQSYSKLLHKGDIVVSTADHEFFCVAIMEAIYCGCHPVLPNRLTYPELIPDNLRQPLLHAPILYDDEDEMFRILKDLLGNKTRRLPKTTLKKINQHLDWSRIIGKYDDLFEELAEKRAEPVHYEDGQ
ncbi:MAG TPA: DUF3524 domain-containing protein [Balneolales bacterium]|nr:DUF3524 domain-containing protein [Balneolales bacterium]